MFTPALTSVGVELTSMDDPPPPPDASDPHEKVPPPQFNVSPSSEQSPSPVEVIEEKAAPKYWEALA